MFGKCKKNKGGGDAPLWPRSAAAALKLSNGRTTASSVRPAAFREKYPSDKTPRGPNGGDIVPHFNQKHAEERVGEKSPGPSHLFSVTLERLLSALG